MNPDKSKNLKQKDVTKKYRSKFSEKLMNALSRQNKATTYLYNDEGHLKAATTVLISAKCGEKKKTKVVERLIFITEDLVSRNYVKSFLSGFWEMEPYGGTSLFCVYPALSPEGLRYAEETYPEYLAHKQGEASKLQFNP